MKAGLLAWPPPPMPAPAPRVATRLAICASAELLHTVQVDSNEAGAAGVGEGAASPNPHLARPLVATLHPTLNNDAPEQRGRHGHKTRGNTSLLPPLPPPLDHDKIIYKEPYQLDRLYELRSCNDYLNLQRCWTTRMESSVPSPSLPAARPP